MKLFRPLLRQTSDPFLVAIAVLLGSAIRLSAANYYVDYSSGSDNNAGTSTTAPWQHCPGDSAATSVAGGTALTSGDTVFFKGGVTYTLTGTTGIALRWNGSGSAPITYDGNSAGTWGTGRARLTDNYGANGLTAFLATSPASYLVFQSFEIGAIGGSLALPIDTGAPAAARFGAGITFAGGVSNALINNCVFHDLGYAFSQKPMNAAAINGTAITASSAAGLTVAKCDFSKLGSAIELTNATALSGLTVQDCTFHDNVVWTIDLPPTYSASSVTVSGCTESNNDQFSTNNWTGYGVSPRTDVQSAVTGASVTFRATAAANPAASFQWQKNGVAIFGATNSSYTLASVASTDAATYTVLATNSAGSTSSNDAVLSVTTPSGAGTAPAITSQPVNQTALLYSTVTFSVVATGDPAPSYQWYKNGTAIGGWTSSTLTLPGVTSNDETTYNVVVTNTAGTVTSNPVTLTLTTSVPTATAPVITSQPTCQAVSLNSTVNFCVSASGSPAPNYQWQKNGVAIPGWTSSTLTLSSVSTNDAATYTATVTNSAGSVTSNAATLTINDPSLLTSAPVITVQPVSVTVAPLSTATFSVVATGNPAPTYQWLKNGTAIAGWTDATLTLPGVTSNDTTTYAVVVSNSAGSATSNAVTLSLSAPTTVPTTSAPVITVQPVDQVVAAFGTATFGVIATGNPAPTYQWLKNGTAIAGWTDATLTLPGVTTNDTTTYTVVVSNSAGSVTSNPVTLSIASAPSTTPTQTPQSAPVITTQPVSQVAVPLSTVTFSVTATGNPAPTYQWLKNGAVIAGWTDATLTLPGVTTNDVTAYAVVVSNSLGSVTSNAVALTLTSAPASTGGTTITPGGTAPVITTQPVDQVAITYSTATFTVVASGSPAPTYQWQKNGTAIGGWTSATLTLPGVTTNDVASYTCVVANSAGSVTSNPAKLTIAVPIVTSTAPVFTTQPTSQTVALKSTLTLSATASGTPDPTYQWMKDGAAISGATSSSYTIRNTSKSSGGTYTVTATNSAGSVTSTPAVLTVSSSTKTAGYLTDSTAADSRLSNLSVRANAGTGNGTLIVGFVVSGSDSKSMLVRGIGPGLASFGLTNTLTNPVLSLYSGSSLVGSNSNWADAASTISSTSRSVGAFALTAGTPDTALTPEMAPGAYTAQITGTNEGTALVELYDAAPDSDARLTNVSVRTTVSPKSDAPIIGFVVSGSVSKKLLLRAVGPSLATFGVEGTLADPKLEIYKDGVRIDQNDNWAGAAAVSSAIASTGAFALPATNSKDAAIVLDAEPGAYSAIVTGVNGASGVVIVEVYEVP